MNCPFAVGDKVKFTPSGRTKGLYQDIERFGIRNGDTLIIKESREDVYLYFEGDKGGWPWNQFTRVK